jgi:hypothetical protein
MSQNILDSLTLKSANYFFGRISLKLAGNFRSVEIFKLAYMVVDI